MTEVHTCTACANCGGSPHHEQDGCNWERPGYEPCGELVAELGPCQWVGLTSIACREGVDGPSHATEGERAALGFVHKYQGRLVHVSPTGLCKECGRRQKYHCLDWDELNSLFHSPLGDCNREHHEWNPDYVERELGHEARRD